MDFEWLETRREIPEPVVEASWMAGVHEGEDRAWRYVGTFPAPGKWPVECTCTLEISPPPMVKLSPLLLGQAPETYQVFLIGQCRECDLVMWGEVL